jgi:F-type H+-transporting ATPase subunit c
MPSPASAGAQANGVGVVGALAINFESPATDSSAAVRRTARAGERTMIELLAEGTQLMGDKGLIALGAGLGAGLVTLGAAKGIGHLAGEAVGAIARQPEAGGRIFTSLIIAAALIEGFTFFALIICNTTAGKI